MDGFLHKGSFNIPLKAQPVTEERKPFVPRADHPFVNAGSPFNIASKEQPGTEERKPLVASADHPSLDAGSSFNIANKEKPGNEESKPFVPKVDSPFMNPGSSFNIATKEQPVTEERKPLISRADHPSVDAGSSSNIATKERPGTEERKPFVPSADHPSVDIGSSFNIATKEQPGTEERKPFVPSADHSSVNLGSSFNIASKEHPVTEERKPFFASTDHPFMDAGTAKANIAPSQERPHSTEDEGPTKKPSNQTVVKQHAGYWDTDGDGVIWPRDTYRGFRKWGWNVPLALLATCIINFLLSYPTVHGYLPDPFFRIHTDRLPKFMHGSDNSTTYDPHGRVRPQHFEDIFAKYDVGHKGGLDKWDVARVWNGHRLVFDFLGMSAVLFEWLATYLLIWPRDGVMRKEDIGGVFDGSIFYKKAEEHQKRQQTGADNKAQGSGGIASALFGGNKKLL